MISSLTNPQEAAAYLEVALEEAEPELLQRVLKNIIQAQAQSNNLEPEAKHCYEKLDKVLLETGCAQIYSLVELLDALGFRITITLKTDA